MSYVLSARKGIPAHKGYYVANNGAKYRYDSMTELALMLIFDKNEDVWRKNISLKIPYEYEGKHRSYIPDFILGEDEKVVIEVKGSMDRPEVPTKFAAAEKWCEEHGKTFKLVSYENIRELIDWQDVKTYHMDNKTESDIAIAKKKRARHKAYLRLKAAKAVKNTTDEKLPKRKKNQLHVK